MRKFLTIVSVSGMSIWFTTAIYISLICLITKPTTSLKISAISLIVWVIPALSIKLMDMKSKEKPKEEKTGKSCKVCKKKKT